MLTSSFLPKVTIVTPSYNQGQFIEKTILSVLCQDYPNIEYIVVDGLSTDATPDILCKYKERIAHTIIEADNGQSDALNKGFNLSTGDILAYLNSDDCYASRNVISTVVKYFIDNTDIDVTYGRRYFIDETGYFLSSEPYRPFDKHYLYLLDYIPQECAFWTRNIFEKAGAYIDTDFDFAMDYELWFRFLSFDANFLSVNNIFGLFRYYLLQKTTDLWRSKGLPEIAKLQNMYLGRALEEAEILNYRDEYIFNANPSVHPQAFNFYKRFWEKNIICQRQILNHMALDEWMFQYFS